MRRALVLALAAAGLAAGTLGLSGAPAQQAAKDWTKTVAATPEGGYRIGNPAAAVKLIEYGSLTCSHCAEFHAQAMPELKRDYIAKGQVSYEFRNFVLNGPDLAASLIARCQGADAFFGHADYFFGQQRAWMEPFTKIPAPERQRLSKLPQDQMLLGFVSASGLEGRMAARGMPAAKVKQCLSDQAQAATLINLRKGAADNFGVQGTPTFLLNGKVLSGVHHWAELKPLIKAAGG